MRILIFYYAEFSAQLVMRDRTIYIGLFLGIILPLVSNILPMKEAMSNTLRNALDKFRNGVDFDVQMVRL